MKRTTLFLLAVTTASSCLFAQTTKNPFSELGYKKQITYTSSKGEFEEFHDNADIVEIGSVYFDTKTNKVVGYVNEEKEKEEVATATSAMSVDPLCEKYYWISPYAYCLNNPVNFIDPDGREVWVIYEDENKKRQNLQYKDGKLYDTKGNLYEGKNETALTMLETLNNIKNTKDGDGFVSKVITTLEKSDKKHYIEKGERNNNYAFPRSLDENVNANNGEKTGSQTVTTLQDGRTVEGEKSTKEADLGHELRHAYDRDQGLFKGENPGGLSTAKAPYEQRARGFENRIRKAMGLPVLKTYSGQPIKPYPYAK